MLESVNFLVSMGLLFGGGSLVIRLLAGWGLLEARYKCGRDSLVGQISRGSYRWVFGRFKYCSVGVAVEIYPGGLWVRAGFPLNVMMKSLYIPWVAIEDVQMKKMLFIRKAHIRIKEFPVEIQFSGEVGYKIFDEFGRAKSEVGSSSLDSDARARRLT